MGYAEKLQRTAVKLFHFSVRVTMTKVLVVCRKEDLHYTRLICSLNINKKGLDNKLLKTLIDPGPC